MNQQIALPRPVTPVSAIISTELLQIVQNEYRMNWNGIHGWSHWMRVRENGLRLAPLTGATPKLVELFAFLHDVCRQNDGWDLEHGKRAAEFIGALQADCLALPPLEIELLRYACANHSAGLIEADITVQTCWDADRLDLGRIGVRPDARWLCTPAAKQPELIEWAYRQSRGLGHAQEHS